MLLSSEIQHTGTPHDGNVPHSGRYEWGSGEHAFQRSRDFLDRVRKLEHAGKTQKEIAESMDITVEQLRSEKSLAIGRVREANRLRAKELSDQGMGATAIGKELGVGESTVRNWLKDSSNKKHTLAVETADILRANADEMRYVDIGKGVAESMGISETRLKAAVAALKESGYQEMTVYAPQVHGEFFTPRSVLCAPGVTMDELRQNQEKIGVIGAHYADPNDINPYALKPIQSISSSRVQIAYADDPKLKGSEKDGVIELRRGVEGLDMGRSVYAQVRICVDGTHFIKGMAVYADDLPDGIDIRFNTNKRHTTPMMDSDPDAKQVLKPIKSDPNNPFGAVIKSQSGYLNIVNEEGDWSNWSKTLASQMLSKQPTALARRQLDVAYKERRQELDDILHITNDTVKKHLLEEYADGCDTAARHLKAAAMPGQATHVILPVNSLKENEVYAPNYKNGERVVLIRFPHAGLFEIPELVVNNKNAEAKRIFENKATGMKAPDAIGIHYKVAQQLSGADFDGDTVLVIPNRHGSIRTRSALEGLKDFDPKDRYPYYEGMKVITKRHQQKEMGVVSNLITDMTIKGADDDEIARAVRYSMVVIDANKHKLNYKQAKLDNDIEGLQKIYQQKPDGKYGGASTLISKAKSTVWVPQRKPGRSGYSIDPATGKKVYKETGSNYEKMRKNPATGEWEGTGKIIFRTSKSHAMDEVSDARELSSGSRIEDIYANYANHMKALANEARKVDISTKNTPYSPSAHTEYKAEADSIVEKVRATKARLPLERKAQALATAVVRATLLEETGMSSYRAAVKASDAERVKKIKTQAIAGARASVGSKKPEFEITDREWEAIQKGAVSANTFKEALRYMNQDKLKERALPKEQKGMTSSKLALAKAKLAAGYTQQEVAKSLGLSVSTLRRELLKGVN